MEALAKKMHVVTATVGHWETGKHKPDWHKLQAIAEITGVNPIWLETGVGSLKRVRDLSHDELEKVSGGFTSSFFGCRTAFNHGLDPWFSTCTMVQPA
jgi:transcriptional regulator with XRE-family HTH domain